MCAVAVVLYWVWPCSRERRGCRGVSGNSWCPVYSWLVFWGSVFLSLVPACVPVCWSATRGFCGLGGDGGRVVRAGLGWGAGVAGEGLLSLGVWWEGLCARGWRVAEGAGPVQGC